MGTSPAVAPFTRFAGSPREQAMPRQSKAQQETVARVMHEFKHGELESSGGRKVKNSKQAIAIALHEAGATNQESPARNRKNLARTKRRESAAERSRQELYAEAKKRGIAGRSRMSKEELVRALNAG
jgi:hypothetical protein